MIDIFKTVCNVGNRTFDRQMAVEEAKRVNHDPNNDEVLPWGIDDRDVKALESFIGQIQCGSTERQCGAGRCSPFFTRAKKKPPCQRDRKMVFWTSLAKSPLSKLFLHMCLHESANESAVTPMFKLMDALAMSLCPTVSVDELHDLEVKINAACDAVEIASPAMCSTICMHLLRHTPDQMRRTGPTHCSWTYFLERCVRFARCNCSTL